jgi:hypothetical protein
MRPRIVLSQKTRLSLAALLAGMLAIAHAGPVFSQVLVPAGPQAQNEPSITLLPNNVAVLGFNTQNPLGSSGFGVSAVGGGVWPNVGVIPLPAPFISAGDPALDFNSTGQVFYAMLGVNRNRPICRGRDLGPAGIFVAPSFAPFPGIPPFWRQPVPVSIALEPCVDLDKEYIAIDRISPARFPLGSRDNIYISFSRFGPGALARQRKDIQFSRSTNFGMLYSRPFTISETLNLARASDYRQASIPAAAPINGVYVAWVEVPNSPSANVGPGVIRIQRSTDGGWSFPLALPGLAAPVQSVEILLNRIHGSRLVHTTIPTMAVNTVGALAGQVYVAFADRRGGQLDIFFARDVGAGFPALPCACQFGARYPG